MRVELDNGCLSCTILPFGATLQSLRVPDREGKLRDVCWATGMFPIMS